MELWTNNYEDTRKAPETLDKLKVKDVTAGLRQPQSPVNVLKEKKCICICKL